MHNWLVHRSDINHTGSPRRALTACYMDGPRRSTLTATTSPSSSASGGADGDCFPAVHAGREKEPAAHGLGGRAVRQVPGDVAQRDRAVREVLEAEMTRFVVRLTDASRNLPLPQEPASVRTKSRRIGAGGMGIVYRAAIPGSTRRCDQGAAGSVRDGSGQLTRFDREAQLLASLNHRTSRRLRVRGFPSPGPGQRPCPRSCGAGRRARRSRTDREERRSARRGAADRAADGRSARGGARAAASSSRSEAANIK